MDWKLIVTSAAVGAVVSGAFQFLGQMLERRSRRRERLFDEAIRIALIRREQGMAHAKAEGYPFVDPDPVVRAAGYYKALAQLFDEGRIPHDFAS